MIICVSTVHTGVGAGLYPKHISVWRLPPGEAGGQLGVALGKRHPVRRGALEVAAGRRFAARAVGPAGQPAAMPLMSLLNRMSPPRARRRHPADILPARGARAQGLAQAGRIPFSCEFGRAFSAGRRNAFLFELN
jgi:hypothetical protein